MRLFCAAIAAAAASAAPSPAAPVSWDYVPSNVIELCFQAPVQNSTSARLLQVTPPPSIPTTRHMIRTRTTCAIAQPSCPLPHPHFFLSPNGSACVARWQATCRWVARCCSTVSDWIQDDYEPQLCWRQHTNTVREEEVVRSLGTPTTSVARVLSNQHAWRVCQHQRLCPCV